MPMQGGSAMAIAPGDRLVALHAQRATWWDHDTLVEVVLPDQSRQTIPMAPLQGAGEMTSGTLQWAFAIAPPAAGTYGFERWVIDAGDNKSNRLSGSLTAQ